MNKAASGASGAASYSKVPGQNARQGASVVHGSTPARGNSTQNKPPVMGNRLGPNVRPKAQNPKESNKDVDAVMAGNQRSGSARRRAGASAAAYHAESLGLKSNALGPHAPKNNPRRSAAQQSAEGDGYQVSIMEQLGSPEMLMKELRMAKRDIETLKNQLEVKEKSVANYRLEASKLKTENYDLKRQIIGFKERLAAKEAAAAQQPVPVVAAQGNAENDIQAARAMARMERPGRGERPDREHRDANVMAQMQMAMHLSEVENRINERQMFMMAMAAGAGADQAQAEEERLLQRAIEESKNDNQDPNNPDVDRMSYEQLMELGENAGQVSRGYTPAEIARIRPRHWFAGLTKDENCLICIETFSGGKKVKTLKCGHEYDAECIDTWLAKEKRCPVCSAPPF